MNQLLSVRTNIFYVKDKRTSEYLRHQELIFLIDKPSYSYSNEGEIIRERDIAELRFVISDDAFSQVIKHLEKLKDIDESELS